MKCILYIVVEVYRKILESC